MKELFFSDRYLDNVKKDNNDIFWSEEFITSLLSTFDFDPWVIPNSTKYLSITDIQGPMGHLYLMQVDCLEDDPNEQPIITKQDVVLMLEVTTNISELSKLMKQHPDDLYQLEENKLTIHGAHLNILSNSLIQLNSKSTRSSNVLIPSSLQSLSGCDMLIWNQDFIRAVLREIQKKITTDEVNGFYSAKFPEYTSRLHLQEITINPHNKRNKSYASYVLEVCAWGEDNSDPETVITQKLSDDSNFVVVTIPQIIRNSFFAMFDPYDPRTSDSVFRILPAVKVSNIYSFLEYKSYIACQENISTLAKSMMSGILSETTTVPPDTFNAHKEITTSTTTSRVTEEVEAPTASAYSN